MLADKLDEGLHTRLEELVKTVEKDYARLTDVVAFVRWPLKQLLEELIGEEETENLIAGDGGYRVLLLAEAESEAEVGSEADGEGWGGNRATNSKSPQSGATHPLSRCLL